MRDSSLRGIELVEALRTERDAVSKDSVVRHPAEGDQLIAQGSDGRSYLRVGRDEAVQALCIHDFVDMIRLWLVLREGKQALAH